MEIIKSIVGQFYPIVILIAGFSLVVYIFFKADLGNGKGVFENVGGVFVSIIDSDETESSLFAYMKDENDAYVPMLKYTAGTRTVGDAISFKGMFLVQMQNGEYVDASTENGFAIYLDDIKSDAGFSVLEELSSQELDGLEEVPAPFVYDKEEDLLYFFSSGIYTVYIKAYGSGGAMQMYEFHLPVEI